MTAASPRPPAIPRAGSVVPKRVSGALLSLGALAGLLAVTSCGSTPDVRASGGPSGDAPPAVERVADFSGDAPKGMRVRGGAGASGEPGARRFALSGTGYSWLNFDEPLALGEFAGAIALSSSYGDDAWIGFQWGTRERSSCAPLVGGFFVAVRADGSAELREGPWTASSRPVARASLKPLAGRSLSFRVRVSGGRHSIEIDGERVWTLERERATPGWCGALARSDVAVEAHVHSLSLSGVGVAPRAAPPPVAPPSARAEATGGRERYAARGVSYEAARVDAHAFPSGAADDDLADVPGAFLVGATEVPWALWKEVRDWATDPARGEKAYSFGASGSPAPLEGAESGTSPDRVRSAPVVSLPWRAAIVWCNAFTEWYAEATGDALDPVYWADPSYSILLRDASDDFSFDGRPGSADLPYVKATVPGNTRIDACVATGFRLPSRREYELASRFVRDADSDRFLIGSGEAGPGSWPSGAASSDRASWDAVAVLASRFAMPVGSRSANALGVFDLNGNVQEWCHDAGREGPQSRILSSGSWAMPAREVGAGLFFEAPATYRNGWWGFRVARNAERIATGRGPGREALLDSSFSRGGATWRASFAPPAAGRVEFASGAARIVVDKPGAVTLVSRDSFPIVAGRRYRLSFAVSGADGSRLSVAVLEDGIDFDRDGNPAGALVRTETAVSASVARKACEFVARADAACCVLAFSVSGAPGAVTVSGVSLKELP